MQACRATRGHGARVDDKSALGVEQTLEGRFFVGRPLADLMEERARPFPFLPLKQGRGLIADPPIAHRYSRCSSRGDKAVARLLQHRQASCLGNLLPRPKLLEVAHEPLLIVIDEPGMLRGVAGVQGEPGLAQAGRARPVAQLAEGVGLAEQGLALLSAV